MNFAEVLTKKPIVAVVGASNNSEKYGYRVYKFLKDHGYEVYPVNPGQETVQGDKAYKTIADLPVTPEIVDVVTPPEVSAQIYKQAETLGIKYFWLQPGAEDETLTQQAKQNLEQGVNPEVIYDHCIMVETSRL